MSDQLYTMADVVDQQGVVECAAKALEEAQFKLGNMIRYVHRQTLALGAAAEPAFKNDKGGLNDLGIRKINRMLEAGDSTSWIAKAMDISESAVSYRRRRWEEAKKREATRQRIEACAPPGSRVTVS